MTSADVLICGGAVTGCAVAHYLAEAGFDGRVVVVEADPGHARAATALSASGIRQQFSTPLNIRLSAFGLEVIRDFGLDFVENGYLYLAATEAQADRLRDRHDMQRAEGADIALMGPEALAARYPALETADVRLAALGLSGEGWFDGMGLMQAFRDRSRARGVSFVADRVVGLDRVRGRVAAARLASGGRIACGVFVNASGGAGADVAAMAGIALPVERRKRTVFCYHAADPPPGPLPLVIDPSGVWFRPEGARFLAACPPDPDPAVDAEDFEPDHALWEDVVWPALAARSRHFEALKLAGFWAGHYDMNIMDANVIVGPHPEVENFLCANGFSGHGLQQAAGVGRGLAEWIAHGRWVSLDLGPLGFGRLDAAASLREVAVI